MWKSFFAKYWCNIPHFLQKRRVIWSFAYANTLGSFVIHTYIWSEMGNLFNFFYQTCPLSYFSVVVCLGWLHQHVIPVIPYKPRKVMVWYQLSLYSIWCVQIIRHIMENVVFVCLHIECYTLPPFSWSESVQDITFLSDTRSWVCS